MGNIFTGILISLFVFLNGILSRYTNDMSALFIVHVLGFLSILLIKFFKKSKIEKFPVQYYLYLGGLCNIVIIFLENVTMKEIGISFTILFIIIGQLMFSLIVDHFGLFGRESYKFGMKKSMGLLLIFAGIAAINI
jgi:transporter family-2 protein